MNGCTLLLLTVGYFVVFYFLYGTFLAKKFGIDPKRKTPAETMTDGRDYTKTPPYVLFGHHFASIAGAGPIVGPILAAELGWVPALIWIFVGCVFVGAMHDMAALFLSVRNQGKSIPYVIEKLIGYSGRILFSIFCWTALVLVVAIFALMIAEIFVKFPSVATASLGFIALAPIFGACVNSKFLGFGFASCIFVPLTFLMVWVGVSFPFDVQSAFGFSAESALWFWLGILALYAFVASVVPVHWLLQPRDYLNSFLLYALAILGILGVLFSAPEIAQPGYLGLHITDANGTEKSVIPTIFIVVACGACSGFHSLVASGTTSKQIANERHIQPVGYGGMLLEGVIAVMALVSVIYLSGDEFTTAIKQPQIAFAQGISKFTESLGLPGNISMPFISLVLAAFMMTTLDTATRLGRFLWQEIITGRTIVKKEETLVSSKRTVATNVKEIKRSPIKVFLTRADVSSAIMVIASMLLALSGTGNAIWPVFGASNQLLAALTLLGVTVWLARTGRNPMFALLPTIFMTVMSCWGLFQIAAGKDGILRYVSIVLLILTFILIFQSSSSVFGKNKKNVLDE